MRIDAHHQSQTTCVSASTQVRSQSDCPNKQFAYHNGPFLTAFIGSIMPDALKRFMGASDVVQSVLVRALRNNDLLQSLTEEQHRAWLTQVARRRIIDGLRHFRLLDPAEPEQESLSEHPGVRLPVESQELGPDELLELQEQADLLVASIKQLPEDVQQLMAMRYTQELTFEQISQMTGWPVTTCRRKWLKGCDLLRVRLRPLLDDSLATTTKGCKPR